MTEIRVSASSDLTNGQMKLLDFDSYEIGVYRHDDQLYAYRSQCPHQGGPACEGMIIGKVCDVLDAERRLVQQTFDDGDMRIVCPWHGWEFHMKDGRNVCDPKLGLRAHKVFEREGEIYVVV
jgi:nitrite reductase/ring-hydroxylating ferredoxin subunit